MHALQHGKGGSYVRDDDYLNWIRQLPCIVCLIQAGYLPSGPFHSDPHHIPPEGGAAMGLKASDYRAVPLCRRHHNEYDNINMGRHAFAEKYGLSYEKIIAELNRIYRERGY